MMSLDVLYLVHFHKFYNLKKNSHFKKLESEKFRLLFLYHNESLD